MPIYEYRCEACGHELESLQRLSDAPLRTCPQCGKETLSKQVSAAGFQLKGSGWYATDFKHSGSKPATKAVPSAEAKTEGAESKSAAPAASDAKAEAKTEAKTESKPASAAPVTSTGTTPAGS